MDEKEQTPSQGEADQFSDETMGFLSSLWRRWLAPDDVEELDQQEPLPQAAPTGEADTPSRKNSNWVYVAWFLFYFFFFLARAVWF